MIININNYSYDTIDIIGKGFTSIVYRGINTINHEMVALKIIQKPCKIKFNEYNMLKLFIGHNNIVQVYDYIETDLSHILILELCDTNLDALINNKCTNNKCTNNKSTNNKSTNNKCMITTKISLEQIKDILLQFIKIIYLLNRFKIIHHDIKPTNILIKNIPITNQRSSNICVKLCDFEMGLQYENVHNKLCGSQIYMHPTKLLYDFNYNSDEWSFSVIFYELVYGFNPFKGSDSKHDLINRIYKNKVLYPSENVYTPILKKIFKSHGFITISSFENEINNMHFNKNIDIDADDIIKEYVIV